MGKLQKRFSNRSDTWYEMVGINCPICGHAGYCMINEKETKVVCTREDTYDGKKGIKFGKDGSSFLFRLKNDSKLDDNFNKKNFNNYDVINHKLKDNNMLNYVYRCILSHAYINGKRLNDESLSDLKRRGLSSETIKNKGFASLQYLNLSSFAKNINGSLTWDRNDFETNYKEWFTEDLLPSDAWKGVPGFYNWKHKEYKDASHNEVIEKENVIFAMTQTDQGIPGFDSIAEKRGCPRLTNNGDYVIPAVDIDNNIFGMQIRHLDKNASAKYTWVSSKNNNEGTTTNTGVNVALIPELEKHRDTPKVKEWLHNAKKTVIITEGVLKSIVAAEKLPEVYSKEDLTRYGSVVLGNAGVSQWRKFLPVLKELNATNVIVAYDMDYEGKKEVERSRNALINALKKYGYHVSIAQWDKNFKGIDDALQAGQRLQFKDCNNMQLVSAM